MSRLPEVLFACEWILFSTACGTHQQSITNATGTQALVIERIWWWMFTVLTVVFVLVVGFMGAALKRSHVGTAEVPERQVLHPEQDRRMSRIILVLVGIVILFEFAFLIASASKIDVVRAPESKNPVQIEVIGHQWWWEFRYPSSNASETVVTANELHLPSGTPVLVKTSSADVIHSFWIPNIAAKRDLIPGYQTAFWIQAEKEGTYRGQCAEFCGHQHAHMAMYAVVESMEKFREWLNGQRKPAVEPATEEARRGRDVFLSSPCVTCHSIRGTEAGSRVGPDLTHLASRSFIGAGTLPNTRGNLAGWILDSQSVKPGNRMPTIALSAGDLENLLAYLQSLK